MRVLAALACALFFSISSAWAQQAPALDPRLAPVRTHYDRLAQAYAEADLPMVLAYRTPDFHVELPGGALLDYATTQQIVQDLFAANTGEAIIVRTDIQCARMRNEAEAEFVVVQNLEQTVALDQPRRVLSATRQTEVWRLTAEGWRLASISSIEPWRRWVDGVEVDPRQPYDPDAPAFTPASAAPAACPGSGYNTTAASH
jgi:hypothetical protein